MLVAQPTTYIIHHDSPLSPDSERVREKEAAAVAAAAEKYALVEAHAAARRAEKGEQWRALAGSAHPAGAAGERQGGCARGT